MSAIHPDETRAGSPLAGLHELLPSAWHLVASVPAVNGGTGVPTLRHGRDSLDLLGVITPDDRPVLVGPGGLVVLVARSTSRDTALRPDGATAAAGGDRELGRWNGVERRRPHSAQVTAELVAHLVGEATGVMLTCQPAVVLADGDTRVHARLDDVAVLHRHRVGAWLDRRPRLVDPDTVDAVRAALAQD